MREPSSSAVISWLSSSLDAAGRVSSLFFFSHLAPVES